MALGALLPELAEGAPRTPLIDLVTRWGREKPDAPAFTFVDYSSDPKGVKDTITWGETFHRARTLAIALRRHAQPGDRAALLLPQRHEYLLSMLACMYAHVIAVPLFSPDAPGHADRLVRAYADAEPAVVITVESALPHVEKFLHDHDVPTPREIIFAETESIPDDRTPDQTHDRTHDRTPDPNHDLSHDRNHDGRDEWQPEPVGLDDVAYLQYTSGSTRAPAGVEITHGNMEANARQVWSCWKPGDRTPIMVSWLPLFHDMGLIATLALPMFRGDHTVFADPVSFLMRPLRWLQLITDYRDMEVYTVGPNFAYDYVTDAATPEKVRDLDLTGLSVCLNGAEPIRPRTLERFAETFRPAGLRRGAQGPGYGLAEATVFVAVDADDEPPRILTVDREALRQGRIEESADGGGLVSCGRPMGQYVAIVDPETCREQPDGHVGEIWLHGPNVAPGYWRNSERSQDVFGGRLVNPASGLPAGPWLRTGDYGAIHDGELYVTGRIKDLIIVDGRNHYPQDLEMTAQEAHPAIRPEFVAAFAVQDEETERLVIVAERNRRVPLARLDLDEIETAVRAAVNHEHEMRVHDFVLIEPGTISRTSSGKIARAATRQRFLAGELPTTGARLAART
jgi:acyl-CoA synthetase (AMP-forming)/AMP-acid ligase II